MLTKRAELASYPGEQGLAQFQRRCGAKIISYYVGLSMTFVAHRKGLPNHVTAPMLSFRLCQSGTEG
jgi:hypothetical protein